MWLLAKGNYSKMFKPLRLKEEMGEPNDLYEAYSLTKHPPITSLKRGRDPF